MANMNAPFGFRPVRRDDAAAVNYALSTRLIDPANVTPIGKGDLVKSTSTGFIELATPGGTRATGIFWGCTYYDTAQQRVQWMNQWPGVNTTEGDIVAYILDDPRMLFEAQVTGASPVTVADIGNNIDIAAGTITHAGFSGMSVNFATIATTATLPFRIVGLSQGVGNGYDATAQYNRVLVRLNAVDATTTTGL